MRWFAFGRAVGVRWDGEEPAWAAVRDNQVVDASLMARSAGVKPGLSAKAAAALLPGLAIRAAEPAPAGAVRRLWRAVGSVTPRVETVGEDAFYAECSVSEGRDALTELYAVLSGWLAERPGVRGLTLGVAETPGLARALTEWRQIEPVPGVPDHPLGAGGRLLLSPRLACDKPLTLPARNEQRTTACAAATPWWMDFPVAALWPLPPAVREALIRFGVFKWADLEQLGEAAWQRWLPDIPWLWLRREVCVGRLRVNYPPPVRFQTWVAAAGETCPPAALPALLRPLATELWRQLVREGWNARRVGMCWRHPDGGGRTEAATKRSAADAEMLYIHLVRLAAEVRQPVERLTVFARDFTALRGEQLILLPASGGPRPAATAAAQLDSVLEQVERRFPGQLRKGMRPGFRELRLERLSYPAPVAGRAASE